MSMRRMAWSTLVAGVCLVGSACGPSMEAEARESSAGTVEQKAGQGDVCGGFAGLSCDPGYVCVDDPNDSCDPTGSGRDCAGICQCGTGPDYEYILTDPARCETVRFTCEDRREPFFNACGCGCKVTGA